MLSDFPLKSGRALQNGLRMPGGESIGKMTEPEQFYAAAAAVSDEYDADLFVYSGPIDSDGYGQVTSEISRVKRAGSARTKALLILVTNGGSANAGYQIARMFQRQYDEFLMFCPSVCKSAGTLVALGAHRLLMDVFSELGPLDVQLIKQNEIASRKSGLLAKSSFDALADSAFELYERLMIGITLKSSGNVSFKIASELSASMASTMLSPVYAQINPEIVGSENRDLTIAFDYGSRLVNVSRNATTESVFRLVHDYPSHDFIIDDEEARTLFNVVEEPSENLYKIIGILGDIAYDEASSAIVCGVPSAGGQQGGAEGDAEGAQGGPTVSPAPEAGLDPMDSGRHGDRPSDPEAPEQNRAANSATDGGEPIDNDLKVRPLRNSKGS